MNRKWRLKKKSAWRVDSPITGIVDPDSDPGYLEWIRSLPCAVKAHALPNATFCSGSVEAHHPRNRAGLARKSPDRTTIPLCHGHHMELHDVRGTFSSWVKAELKNWQAIMSDTYRLRFAG